MPNLTLFFYFLSVLIFVYGKRKLVMYKNNETTVAWNLVTVDGQNLILTCKIEDPYNTELANEVVWRLSIFKYQDKYPEQYSSGNRIDLSEPDTIRFTPVRSNDAGPYTCVDAKHTLRVRLELTVVSEDITVHREKHPLYGYEYYPLGLPKDTNQVKEKSKTNVWAILGGILGLILGSILLWFCFKNSITNNVAFTRAIRVAGPRNDRTFTYNGRHLEPSSDSLLETSAAAPINSHLPPSYDTSIKRSENNAVPPTYDEATANA